MHARRPDRAGLALLLAGAAAAAGCGGELLHEGAALPLVRRLDRADLEAESPPELPPGTSVRWVRHGYAGLALRLLPAEAEFEAVGARRTLRWNLPLPPAEHAEGAALDPVIEGLAGAPVPRLVVGGELPPDAGGAFRLADARLHLSLGTDVSIPDPEALVLVYPVHAARLAGTGLLPRVELGRVLGLKRLRGDVAVESVALPTPARLEIPLPPLPDGRLTGELALLASAPDAAGGRGRRAGTEVRARLRLGDEELFEAWLPPDGEPVPILAADGRPPRVPFADEGRVLAIEIDGPPGGLVSLERAGFVRRRSWREGPNVLVLVVDGLRADRVGAYGSRAGLTPAIDRLAAEGVRFASAWSTSSWSLPVLGTLLTSLHAAEHGATRPDRRLGRGVATFPEVLRAAGYRTAAFTGGGFSHPLFGVDRGFELFDARGGSAEEVVARARDFVEAAGDGPWLALVHVADPTAPYQPSSAHARATALEGREDTIAARLPDPRAFEEAARRGERPPAEEVEALARLHDEEVRATDRAFRGLLDALRASGRLDGMVVALVATHGEEFGEHGFLGHGDTLYAEVLHVPLVVRLPRAARAGEVVERPVSLRDFAAMLLDAAGLEDAARAAGIRGRSLLGEAPPSPVYAEREAEAVPLLRCLRAGRMVAINGPYAFPALRPHGPELYDLLTDPRQERNVATDEGRRRQVIQMLGDLDGLTRHQEPRTEGTRASDEARALARRPTVGY